MAIFAPAQYQGGGAGGEIRGSDLRRPVAPSYFNGFSIPNGGRGNIAGITGASPNGYYDAGPTALSGPQGAMGAGGATAGGGGISGATQGQRPGWAVPGGGGGYQDVYNYAPAIGGQLLYGKVQGTSFGPGGWATPEYLNQYIQNLMGQIRNYYAGQVGGQENRAVNAAILTGQDDPSRMGYSLLQSGLRSQSDAANALGQASLWGGQQQYGAAQGWQDFIRNLLMSELGGSYSHWNTQEMAPKGGVNIGLPGVNIGLPGGGAAGVKR